MELCQFLRKTICNIFKWDENIFNLIQRRLFMFQVRQLNM